MNVNGVNIEYQYDGAHDARPTEHTLHGLDGLNLSGLDWMRLSHVCHLMAARDRKPKRAFVRVSGWTADRPNMRLIVDVLQDDDGTASVPLPLTSDYLLVDSGECDGRLFQYGWLDVLEQLPEHVDYGRLDATGMRVVDWLNGMADPKYMRKIQGMCRCQDCGLMADNTDIDVELDCDEIVFEWSDADDSQTCNLPPCYGGHRLQTDMTAYDLLLELGVIDDPYARNKERD